MLRIVLLFVFVVACVTDQNMAFAQSPELRYQLGRRLTRFERQWQTADSASRVRSTPKMMSAVSSFFSLQLCAWQVWLLPFWFSSPSGTMLQ